MKKNIHIDGIAYTVASDDDYLSNMGDDFEPHMVQLFKALIEPDDTVIDIGANIGLTCMLFASLADQVIAFEPSPTTYRLLVDNLQSAGMTNVTTVNTGLGSGQESMTLSFSPRNRSGGYVSDDILEGSGLVSECITIDTVDHYFRPFGNARYFVKIDVEGFEQQVIKGAMGWFLERQRPIVVMEMNHFCLNVLHRITIPDFLDFMRSVFPRLYAVDSNNQVIADLHDPEKAYMVMHEHVVHNRFPNLVGGFDDSVVHKLNTLSIQTPTVRTPKGSIVSIPHRAIAARDELMTLEVTVTNTGTEDWHGTGAYPVLLAYHWRNEDGSTYIYDGVRTPLFGNLLQAGSSVDQGLVVSSPKQRGTFSLELTALQEGIRWFDDEAFETASWLIVID